MKLNQGTIHALMTSASSKKRAHGGSRKQDVVVQAAGCCSGTVLLEFRLWPVTIGTGLRVLTRRGFAPEIIDGRVSSRIDSPSAAADQLPGLRHDRRRRHYDSADLTWRAWLLLFVLGGVMSPATMAAVLWWR